MNDERPKQTETDRPLGALDSVADFEPIDGQLQRTEIDRSLETTNVVTETEPADNGPKLTINERLQKIAAAGPPEVGSFVGTHSNGDEYRPIESNTSNDKPKEQRPRRTINRPRRLDDYVC